MNVRGRFQQVYDGKPFPLERKHLLRCCDCGLVHLFKFRISKGKILATAVRMTQLTAGARRSRKWPCRKQK